MDIDDLAYVIYEADNIAAGADRREAEGDLNDRGAKFDSDLCLENIFNVFSGDAESSYFSLHELDAIKKDSFPHGNKSIATQGQYASIMRYLEKNFRMKSPISMEENELLRILEDTLIYVPSSTNTEEHADISLYDHMKMTGATAAVLMKYMEMSKITDYKEFCFTHNKENRNKDVFLMISGDFSGIQKFIYHIRSEGAMRMLRGRFFLLGYRTGEYSRRTFKRIASFPSEPDLLQRRALLYSGRQYKGNTGCGKRCRKKDKSGTGEAVFRDFVFSDRV